MKRNSKLSLILLPIMLFCTKAFVEEIDYEAVKNEENKQIVLFDPKNAHEQYRLMEEAMNEIDAHDDYNYSAIEFLPETKRTPEEKAQELKRQKESEKRFWTGEKKIYEDIIKLEEKYNQPVITSLRQAWKKAIKTKSTHDYPSDLARKIGKKLAQMQLYDAAIEFYWLAMLSDRCGYEEFLLIGDAYVAKYNNLVSHQRPKEPNAQLFSLLTNAMHAYKNGSYCCEVGDFLASDLKCERDKMVRWPFSPSKVLNDDYYATYSLAKKLYHYSFVDNLLKDIQTFKKIFSAQKCDASKSEENLAQALYDTGFYGVSKPYNRSNQYIFVNKDGYIVRVKQNPAFKNWEFTVGLTFLNPFKWDENNEAFDVVQNKDISFEPTCYRQDVCGDLLSHQYNEIFKITFHNNVPMVVPPFRDFYWSGGINNNAFLKSAHRNLKRSVDYKKIQTLLSF